MLDSDLHFSHLLNHLLKLIFHVCFCKGDGCRVCSQTGWLEVLGCGVVDENVFKKLLDMKINQVMLWIRN